MTTQMSLSVKYRNEYTRTNENDGSKYTVWCYRVLKSNHPATIEQLKADTTAQGYNILIDEESGDMLFRSTRPVPEGCNIIRTSSGRWIADKSKLRQLNALAAEFPNLGIGEAVTKMLMGNTQQSTNHVPDEPKQDPQINESIDPFKQ